MLCVVLLAGADGRRGRDLVSAATALRDRRRGHGHRRARTTAGTSTTPTTATACCGRRASSLSASCAAGERLAAAGRSARREPGRRRASTRSTCASGRGRGGAFDLQAGRIPPVFGALRARAATARDNPLIGDPLAYQYLTTLRADALPARRRRPAAHARRRLARRLSRRLQTGTRRAAARGRAALGHGRRRRASAAERLQVAAAVTQGTLSNPRVRDDNDGKQISARVDWRPGCRASCSALSAARGAYLAREAHGDAAAGDRARPDLPRSAPPGADVEYSRGHWLLRARKACGTPGTRPPPASRSAARTLTRAGARSLEGRYKLWPGVYVAARFDRLGFGDVHGTDRTGALGRARLAPGDGRRLHVTRAALAQGRLPAQLARRRLRAGERPRRGARRPVWF